jgi:hypothetical protein
MTDQAEAAQRHEGKKDDEGDDGKRNNQRQILVQCRR